MTQKLKEAINALSSLKDLPDKEQQNLAAGIFELVALAKRKSASMEAEKVQDKQPIWKIIDELGRGIPEEELSRLPKDGAAEHDHYIYGTPKRYA